MATGISFSGLGSGIDFSKVTDAVIADRQRPVARLQDKTVELGRRGDLLKQLNGLLATLASTAEALSDRELGSGRSATPSDASVLAASAASSAAKGRHAVEVTRLASALSQSSRSFAATTEAVLPGGVATATFELRKGGAATGAQITIDSTNNTLSGLRDAINAADAGVRASIVDVTGRGEYQLVLNSGETGAAGRVELVETTDPDSGALAALTLRALNPPGATTDFSALDAELKVNGLTITRASNTVADALEGVTLNLRKVGSSSVEVAASADVSDKLKTFVSAFNAVQDFVNAQYKPDGQGRPTGALAGDPTLRTVTQALREALSTPSSDNGGAFTTLSDIGLARGKDGRLSLDADVLNNKLASNQSDVRALLSGLGEGQTGFGQRIHSSVSQMSEATGGTVQAAIEGYKTTVEGLNKQIAAQLERLSALRDSLTRQFAAADAAIGQLNGQGTALTNILKALEPKK
jgi:flagellar hook-associated protein 2